MKKHYVMTAFMVLTAVFFLVNSSQATLWDFNGLTVGTNINGVNLGGVTITAPDNYVGVIGSQSFNVTNGICASSWSAGMTLKLTFDSLVKSVSIYGGDYGGDSDRFSMTAYDALDNQIAFADTGSYNGIDPNYPVSGWYGDYRYLAVSANDIKSVVLTQVTWGCIWDNLDTTPVPIPAAFWLLGSGLLGLVGLKKKFRK
ncbi:VPLPA-CTERM protein sorting domain-containing protein [Syntrophus gentianae]|uniref:VPLPA-CTERM protein sorting domain-containing protein n=1 Tax=Syntrophus gentianae TaxID=43775 RepID=A0A1H8B0S1_9BACT|nr:VPLPA-CTERM sorting domain-containing protein [Syntrophus gentianae]SEM75698.1 VPLPA-CTERM protein sorting domain-containing protein [Syntrophus gentianae]